MNLMSAVVDRFVQKWNRNDTPTLVDEAELLEVETKLQIRFPEPYRYLVQKYGDVYSPEILDKIVDEELDLQDIQNFEIPSQAVIDTAAYENAGMPTGFIAIANDCMGNVFCLKLDECQKKDHEASIWFFDHDLNDIEKVSESFGEWLEPYAEL